VSPRKRNTSAVAKKTGKLTKSLKPYAVQITQGKQKLYAFTAKASALFAALSINRRNPDKDEGYQRVLSVSRVEAISRYLSQGKPIPGAIIVSLEKATYDAQAMVLTIPPGTDVGWVIDGQHRLAGAAQAAKAGTDVELPVIAFVGLDRKLQIEQFVTINREAKNVPTSLYIDLLKHLPSKNAADALRERANDLATELRKKETSPFFEKLAAIGAPRRGQISVVNFVRKISLHIAKNGVLSTFTEQEQLQIISNYYQGLRNTFAKEFDSEDSLFFKTVGFGALWNVFPTVFSLSLNHFKGFTVKDVAAVFKKIENTDFVAWNQYGSGDQAERTLGEEIRASLVIAFASDEGTSSTSIKL
jgi:DGQHR domain-containing protein